MSLAVLLTLTGGEIEGAQAVRKSFPDFFEKLKQLKIEVQTHETDI
jgi:3-phosphoshikimate 1-carboxyvinyltransferase